MLSAGETYPAVDRLGSVVSTSDGQGQYLGATSYLPYGQSRTGAPPPGAGFGFAGYRYDAETGLYYVRNRYYVPRLGRWLQPDPIGQEGGVNLYAYVGNDPLNATDPDGLFAREMASAGYELLRKAGSDIAQIGSDFLSDPVDTARRLGPSLGGFGAAAGELPGVIQGAAKAVNLAGSVRNVNPTGGTQNCVNCAIATDATLAGRPASALSGNPTSIIVLEQNFGAKFGPMTGINGITESLQGAGNGARGIVFGSRGTDVGHVFNGINQNGVIRFLDGQGGGVARIDGYQGFRLLRTN